MSKKLIVTILLILVAALSTGSVVAESYSFAVVDDGPYEGAYWDLVETYEQGSYLIAVVTVAGGGYDWEYPFAVSSGANYSTDTSWGIIRPAYDGYNPGPYTGKPPAIPSGETHTYFDGNWIITIVVWDSGPLEGSFGIYVEAWDSYPDPGEPQPELVFNCFDNLVSPVCLIFNENDQS